MRNTMHEKGKRSGALMQAILSVIAIALGALLLFVPQIQVKTLCYIFCGALIAVGVASVITFFVTESYRNMESYDFALGVMLLLLGCCALLRVGELAEDFEIYMGITSLFLAVLILQGTVQMRVLQNKLWMVNMALTVISIVSSVLVLADVRAVTGSVSGFTWWVLLLVGAACLLSLLLTTLGVRHERRKAEKQVQSEETV